MSNCLLFNGNRFVLAQETCLLPALTNGTHGLIFNVARLCHPDDLVLPGDSCFVNCHDSALEITCDVGQWVLTPSYAGKSVDLFILNTLT